MKHPATQRLQPGCKIDPGVIRRTALLTVEGERDDICGIGQTLAAQDLCVNLKQYLRTHYVQAGVGHYGVFSGRRLEQPNLSGGTGRHSCEPILSIRGFKPTIINLLPDATIFVNSHLSGFV